MQSDVALAGFRLVKINMMESSCFTVFGEKFMDYDFG